ncbi:MAG: hypothetical protein JWR38_2981 [Mucilaginibacter sp.]|nr:hypothetical protein [Mucilaginibacter sp.]
MACSLFNKMKLYCCFFLFFVTSAVSAKVESLNVAGNIRFQNKSDEDVLTTKLFKLAEVKQLDKELKQYKANASIMITSAPTAESPYYEISVGYNSPSRFETRYYFRIKKNYINQSNIEPYVEVMDMAEADYISLFKYRKKSHL